MRTGSVVGFNVAEGWSRDVSEEVATGCGNVARMRCENSRRSWRSLSTGTPGRPQPDDELRIG